MSTHHHDPEVIAAAAEGRLRDAAAVAGIAACSECAAELAAQEAALSALGSYPSYELTELEAARIRRAVRSELGIRETVAFEPTPRRSRVPLAALGTAAAVLAAVVIAGPALDLIGGGASDGADPTVATESAADSFGETRRDADGGGAMDQAEAPEQGQTQATDLTTTTVQASVGGLGDEDRYAYFLNEATARLGEVAAEGDYEEELLKRAALSLTRESVIDRQATEAALCITVTLTNEPNFVDAFQVARGDISGREVVYVVYLAETLEESAVVAHAVDNCEVMGRSDS